MKQNPPRKKTAAELEKERRLRDAQWWQKVIIYYLNQMYHDEVDRQVEKYRPKLLVEYMADYIREQKTIQKLAEKQAGKPTLAPADDPRSAYDPSAGAEAAFAKEL